MTLNLDYQTYIQPMRAYLYKGIGFTWGIMLLLGFILFRSGRARAEQEKKLRENRFLQELSRERELKIHAGKLSQIGTMTGKIAHDFRNFLMPIIGRAEYPFMAAISASGPKQEKEAALRYFSLPGTDSRYRSDGPSSCSRKASVPRSGRRQPDVKPDKKALMQRNRVCNTLSHPICRPSVLLHGSTNL